MHNRRALCAVLLVLAVAACGGSSSSRTRAGGTGTTVANTTLARCASTFRAIITNANSQADPAWVNYFLSQNQAKGFPVAIGESAFLGTNTENSLCTFDFLTPGDPRHLIGTVYFTPGHYAFDGSSTAPVLTGPATSSPSVNVRIGPDGELTYLAGGSLVAGASSAGGASATTDSTTTTSSANSAPAAPSQTESAPPPTATTTTPSTSTTPPPCNSSHSAYARCATAAAPYCEQGQCFYPAPPSGPCARGYRRALIPGTSNYDCQKPLQ